MKKPDPKKQRKKSDTRNAAYDPNRPVPPRSGSQELYESSLRTIKIVGERLMDEKSPDSAGMACRLMALGFLGWVNQASNCESPDDVAQFVLRTTDLWTEKPTGIAIRKAKEDALRAVSSLSPRQRSKAHAAIEKLASVTQITASHVSRDAKLTEARNEERAVSK